MSESITPESFRQGDVIEFTVPVWHTEQEQAPTAPGLPAAVPFEVRRAFITYDNSYLVVRPVLVTSGVAYEEFTVLLPAEHQGDWGKILTRQLRGPVPADEYDELVAKLAEMTQHRDTLARRATEARANHVGDIGVIGKALRDEADERDWCDDYDNFVQEVNKHLHVELPVREHDYVVTATFSVTLRYTVSAQSEDDAREMGEGQGMDILRHDVQDAVNIDTYFTEVAIKR